MRGAGEKVRKPEWLLTGCWIPLNRQKAGETSCMDLEQVRPPLQEEFIHQNTARMNVAAAREKKRTDGTGIWRSAGPRQKEIAAQIEEIKTEKMKSSRQLEASEMRKGCGCQNRRGAEAGWRGKGAREAFHSSRVANGIWKWKKIKAEAGGFEQTNLDRIGEIQPVCAELEEILEGMETNLVNITRRGRGYPPAAADHSGFPEHPDRRRREAEGRHGKKRSLKRTGRKTFADRKPVGQAVRAG